MKIFAYFANYTTGMILWISRALNPREIPALKAVKVVSEWFLKQIKILFGFVTFVFKKISARKTIMSNTFSLGHHFHMTRYSSVLFVIHFVTEGVLRFIIMYVVIDMLGRGTRIPDLKVPWVFRACCSTIGTSKTERPLWQFSNNLILKTAQIHDRKLI